MTVFSPARALLVFTALFPSLPTVSGEAEGSSAVRVVFSSPGSNNMPFPGFPMHNDKHEDREVHHVMPGFGMSSADRSADPLMKEMTDLMGGINLLDMLSDMLKDLEPDPCSADAHTWCGNISNKSHCLATHHDNLSKECRASIRSSVPGACKDQVVTKCDGMDEGMLTCLNKLPRTSIPVECADALLSVMQVAEKARKASVVTVENRFGRTLNAIKAATKSTNMVTLLSIGVFAFAGFALWTERRQLLNFISRSKFLNNSSDAKFPSKSTYQSGAELEPSESYGAM